MAAADCERLDLHEPGDARPSLFLALGRKLLLSCLGLGLVGSAVAGSIGSTRSAFTARSTNPSNTFAAGTLSMTNAQNASCTKVIASACGILNVSANGSVATVVAVGISKMYPGNYATGTVAITNAGTLPAAVSVSFANLTGTAGAPTGTPTVDAGICGGTCLPLLGTVNSTLSGILNLSLYDSFQSNCLYGTGGAYPASGACDSTITSAAVFIPADGIQSAPQTAVSVTGGGTGGRWAASETHTFTLTVELPSTDAGNAYQGGSATFDLIWSATQ